jgi:hypothetical protein
MAVTLLLLGLRLLVVVEVVQVFRSALQPHLIPEVLAAADAVLMVQALRAAQRAQPGKVILVVPDAVLT